MSRGTVVVNETVFLIEEILLVRGEIRLYATISGRAKGYDGGLTEVRVFGEDGSSIGEVRIDMTAYPASDPPFDNVHVVLPLRITELTQEGGEAEANSTR